MRIITDGFAIVPRRPVRANYDPAVTLRWLVTLWRIPRKDRVELKADRPNHDERDQSNDDQARVRACPRRDTQEQADDGYQDHQLADREPQATRKEIEGVKVKL